MKEQIKYKKMLSDILYILKSNPSVDEEGNITTKGIFEWLLSESQKDGEI